MTMRKTALISTGAAAVVLIGCLAIWFVALRVPPVPMSGDHKLDAAVSIVAWIVEGRPISGVEDRYAASGCMREIDRFYVACDLAPEGALLSNDPRVVLVPEGEWNKVHSRVKEINWKFLEDEVGRIGSISMSFHKERGNRFAIHVSDLFGPLAGTGWYFVFTVEDGRLRASKAIIWVA